MYGGVIIRSSIHPASTKMHSIDLITTLLWFASSKKYRVMDKLGNILLKICDFLVRRSKIFAHREVEQILVHAEIVVQDLGGLKQ
jgi:hypothetical protein